MKSMRRWLVIAAAASVVFLPIAGWLLAHRLSEPMPPIYTVGDLPAVPPPAINGAVRVGSALRSVAQIEELTVLRTEPDPERRRAAIDSAAAVLRARASADSTEIDLVIESMRMPRFADACDPGRDCVNLPVLRAEDLIAARTVVVALD